MATTGTRGWIEDEDGLRRLTGDHKAAWTGLLAAHGELIRGLEADLIAHHGLNLGAFEALMLLAFSEEPLRVSQISERGLLSNSRTSRVLDGLATRGLIERGPCAGDSRVVHVVITEQGRELLREAQKTHFDGLEERFFRHLTQSDLTALERVWRKLLGREPSCDL